MSDIRDVPCVSCQHGYGQRHICESDYCPCDQERLHTPASDDAVLRALDETVEGLELNARLTEGYLESSTAYAVLNAFESFRDNYKRTRDE